MATELSVEDRAIIALARFAFPHKAINFAAESVDQIAPEDPEVQTLIAGVVSFYAATHRD